MPRLSDASAFYVGGSTVSKLYQGANEVWTPGGEPPVGSLIVPVSSSVGKTDTGTTVSAAKPTGMANDDFLVAYHAYSTNVSDGSSVPSGFTPAGTAANSTDTVALRLSYKRITDAGSEPADYSVPCTSGSSNVLHLGLFRNVDPTNPISLAGSWVTTAASLSPSAPTKSLPHSSVLYVCTYAQGFYDEGGTGTTWEAASSGLTLITQTPTQYAQSTWGYEQRDSGASGDKAVSSNRDAGGLAGSFALRSTAA